MKDKTFEKCILLLQNYYNTKLTPERYVFYWKTLRYISDNEFERICVKLIRSDFKPNNRIPFPLIYDFEKFKKDSIDNLAIECVRTIRKAVSMHGMYQSVDFKDNAIHSVIERYGGWASVCQFSDSEWNMKEKAMIEAYKVAKTTGSGDDYVIGLCEITNGKKGEIVEIKSNNLLEEKINLKEIE